MYTYSLQITLLTVYNINIIVLCYSNDKTIACGNVPNCHAINVAIQNTLIILKIYFIFFVQNITHFYFGVKHHPNIC